MGEVLDIHPVCCRKADEARQVVRQEGDHAERHQRRDHMGHHEDPEQDRDADEVADDPAVLQHEAGGDREALANQPRHAVEHEIAEKKADHHEGRAKHDVEEQAPAFDGAPMQAIGVHVADRGPHARVEIMTRPPRIKP